MEKGFVEQQLRLIAKSIDCSPEAIKRLTGALPVTESCEWLQKDQHPQVLDIGLRLDSITYTSAQVKLIEEGLLAAISEYRRVCPSVFRWIVRGDFSVRRIPDDVTKASLLHACRTVGRLRARVFRISN